MKQFLKVHRPHSPTNVLINLSHITYIEESVDPGAHATIHILGAPAPIVTQETYQEVVAMVQAMQDNQNII